MPAIIQLLRATAVALLLSAGLAGEAAAVRVHQGSIQVQGLSRTYTLYLPDSFSSGRRYPVVMLLHGGIGGAARFAENTGIAAHVDRSRFIAVLPESGGEQWNDGRETTRSGRDDVAFLVALVHDLVARSGADPARIFVGGSSAGGMMAQRLACDATNVFTAYAVSVANMPASLAGTCRPARRAPIIFFLATADPFMPWSGGEVRRGWLRGAGGRVLSSPDTVALWSRHDACGVPRTSDLPSRVQDGTHVRLHDFGSCGLVFYEIQGGGHGWPGGSMSTDPRAERIVGNVTRAIDATSVMLDFFRRYGL